MKPQDIESKCSRCGAEFAGRVTDKYLESLGMRKVNGAWVCAFCTGLGLGGLHRGPEQPPEGTP